MINSPTRPATASLAILAVAGFTFYLAHNKTHPQTEPIVKNSNSPIATKAKPATHAIQQVESTGKEPETLIPDTISAEQLQRKMQDKIQYDSLGNFFIETTLHHGTSRDFLLSQWPIIFPDQSQLAQTPEGCGISGYLVEYGAEVALVSIDQNSVTSFVYRCDFNPQTNQYLLQSVDNPSAYSDAIDALVSEATAERK